MTKYHGGRFVAGVVAVAMAWAAASLPALAQAPTGAQFDMTKIADNV